MGCGGSKRNPPNNVIQPMDVASMPDHPMIVQQIALMNNSRKTTLGQTKENTTKAAEDRSEPSLEESVANKQSRLCAPGTYSISDPKGSASPRSVSYFNVICWCNDKSILEQLEQDPILEYVPEGSRQPVVFNRISALKVATFPKDITAVVYLVTHPDDIPLVRLFHQDFSHIWNHFIQISDECEGLQLPSDLPLPMLRKLDNLARTIHQSYLDQLIVLDAYLAQDKRSTVLSRKAGITEMLKKSILDAEADLVTLRKFWIESRLGLWKLKETISKHVNQAGVYATTVLQTLSDRISSAGELTEGNLHFTFGDTGRNYQSQLNVHIGTNTIMEHIALPTASLIKYPDKDCWMCLSLDPNPESVSTIDNFVLKLLAKSTYDKITHEDSSLIQLFGYDIQYASHRLVQGKLYLYFWLSLSHAKISESRTIQTFLNALQCLDRDQEIKGSYKSALSAADFILKSDGNLLEVLLDYAVVTLKWSLTAPVWKLISGAKSKFVQKVCEWVSTACAFADVDMSFQNASDLPSDFFTPQLSLSRLLPLFIRKIREPIECSPSIMKQVQTSLEFYEPKIKIVGRIRNLGIEVSGEVPNLSCLLQHRKTYPFL